MKLLCVLLLNSVSIMYIKVHCKVAYCHNPNLQEPVHFLSNTFYCDGLSVEELQLEDLRERLQGDKIVKLNCFEIVDDFGGLHQKVTLAYIGEEPKIFEITPEDFITEHELSVTINDECDVQDVQPAKNVPKKFLSTVNNSDSEDELEISSKSSSSENSSNDETSLSSRYSKVSNTNKQNMMEPPTQKEIEPSDEKDMESSGKKEMESSGKKEIESPTDYKLLSEMIRQKLERKELHFSKCKADLNALSEEIVDLISLKMSLQLSEEDDTSVCSYCAGNLKGRHSGRSFNSKNKEVQTIVTGDIVAQKKFLPEKRKQ